MRASRSKPFFGMGLSSSLGFLSSEEGAALRVRRVSLGLLTSLAAALAAIPSLCALGIGLSQHRVDVAVSLGETRTVSIIVSNPGDAEKHVAVSLAGLRTTLRGDPVWLDSDGSDGNGTRYEYADIGSAVSVSPTDVNVPPHGSVEVCVHIAAPAVLEESGLAGRVGAIWFDVSDVVPSDGSFFFDNVFRVVAFVLVQFDGMQVPAAEAPALQVRSTSGRDVVFAACFRNIGNVHVAPMGRVVIRDKEDGHTVQVLALDYGTSLPGVPREYVASLSTASLPDGTYSVQAEFDLGTGPSLLSSPYSLILADGEPMLLDL